MPTLTYEKKGHKYLLDGPPLTGVTSVLKVIAKPALIQWAANQAVDYVRGKTKGLEAIGIQQLEEILEEAKIAHRRKKEEAGSKGTDVHSEIEGYIKTENWNPTGNESTDKAVMLFITWAGMNKVKFLASEKQVYSQTHFLAGTLDFICEIDGKKYLGDIKTTGAGLESS